MLKAEIKVIYPLSLLKARPTDLSARKKFVFAAYLPTHCA